MNRQQTHLTWAVVVLILALSDKFQPHNPYRGQPDTLNVTYDYIIVGAGSAGSVLASRLSEDANVSVLVLEAGGDDTENDKYHVPLNAFDLQGTSADWNYYTVPQKHGCQGMIDKRGYVPRGRVLGGSSILNTLQYTRGSRHDFDEWAARGCTGWSYKDVLPYFLKSEDMHIKELTSSKYHSTGGPLAVSDNRVTELGQFYVNAGKELGYKFIDYNGESMDGIGPAQATSRNGVRSSTSVEFLRPIAKRTNLHISTHTFVRRVLFDRKRATGVDIIRDGRKFVINCRKEVILSAGAINSPQILMLSDIGPKDHLQDLGLQVKQDLPVGENLQDHTMLFLKSSINTSGSITKERVSSWWPYLQYKLFGKGIFSSSGVDVTGFFNTDESKRGKISPDIQFLFYSIYLAENKFNFDRDIAKQYLDSREGFDIAVVLTHPNSRGTVKLASTDPYESPLIDPNYFSEKEDITNHIKGIRIAEKFFDTKALRTIGASLDDMNLRICEKHELKSDDYWECIIRHIAVSMHHPSCTCKMGSPDDPSAVVDPQLRVKGINGLRVVDASVMPNIPTGNINAPTIMIAEKAADLIRGK